MQSIGERLEEARKRKGISIREAAEATKIRGEYLHKFESNQFDIKLPEIYVRGFLRSYAVFLKAPADKIINDYKALGLEENKGVRGLNREVYGRMDLSVGSKTEKEAREATGKPADAQAELGDANTDAGPRNPSTFVPPRSAQGNPKIDRDLLMKAGMLVGATAIVVLLSVWIFSGRSSKPTVTTAASSTDAIWVRPLSGEPILSLVASSPVSVTVTTKSEGTTLYQGTIPRGDRREVPRRGELRVVAEPYQSLVFEIGGTPYKMPARAADIRSP